MFSVVVEPEAAKAIVHSLDSDSILLIRRAERKEFLVRQWSWRPARISDVDLLHTFT
jgi:hypothetical protein